MKVLVDGKERKAVVTYNWVNGNIRLRIGDMVLQFDWADIEELGEEAKEIWKKKRGQTMKGKKIKVLGYDNKKRGEKA